MTNYNDGKWHGWNGGECPVDPLAVVDVVSINYAGRPERDTSNYGLAADHCWVHDDDGDIIAFRVVKPGFRVVKPGKPSDPLADLTARVERLEATLKAIALERDRE
jgi:hypothetical protein